MRPPCSLSARHRPTGRLKVEPLSRRSERALSVCLAGLVLDWRRPVLAVHIALRQRLARTRVGIQSAPGGSEGDPASQPGPCSRSGGGQSHHGDRLPAARSRSRHRVHRLRWWSCGSWSAWWPPPASSSASTARSFSGQATCVTTISNATPPAAPGRQAHESVVLRIRFHGTR